MTSAPVTCVTVAASLLSVAPLGGQQVFRSGVDGIVVQVSVRSANRPVGGLTAADFELRDNGIAQEIRTANAEKLPIDLTLLLDLSASVDGPQLQRLKTAVSDTAALLHPEDRIRLVTVSQTLHEVFGLRPGKTVVALDAVGAEGATSLYDGLAATMMRPSDPGRRQLIVAFTDGDDSTSIVDEATAREIAALTDAVVDVVLPVAAVDTEPRARRLTQRQGSIDSLPGGDNIVVGPRGPILPGAIDPIQRSVTGIVKPTGGFLFLLPREESISRVFQQMLDDFRASYVLQYVPTGVAPEGWHELTVLVTKHGRYEVRARKGYRGRSKIASEEEPR